MKAYIITMKDDFLSNQGNERLEDPSKSQSLFSTYTLLLP